MCIGKLPVAPPRRPRRPLSSVSLSVIESDRGLEPMARPGFDRRLVLCPSLLVGALLAASASAQGVKLNGPLVHDVVGDAIESLASPDSSRVIYLADQDV